jgi:predicted NBD/HSP70 family sugar kinase
MAEDGRQAYPDSQIFQGNIANTLRIEEIFQASNHGDPLACSIIDDVTTWFAIGLSNVMLIHDPEAIIFHGMYAGAGDYFLRTLQAKIHAHDLIKNDKDVELAFSSFGKERGVLGGAAYVVAEYFNTHDLYKT